MADIIVILAVAAVIGGAVFYIVKEKKRGVHCIGCPAAGQCSKRHAANSQCRCSSTEQK